LAAADPVAARLVEIALDKSIESRAAIVAIREILNRAGIVAKTEIAGSAPDGTVLWEEFIALRRRVIPDAPADEGEPL
jgi:hypothetical protein